VNIPRKPFSNCYADQLTICTKFEMKNLQKKERMVLNHLLKIEDCYKILKLFKWCDIFVGGRVSQKTLNSITLLMQVLKSQNLTSRGQKIQSKTVSVYLLRYWHYFVAIIIVRHLYRHRQWISNPNLVVYFVAKLYKVPFSSHCEYSHFCGATRSLAMSRNSAVLTVKFFN